MFTTAAKMSLIASQGKKELRYVQEKLARGEALFIALADLRRLRCQRCLPFLGTSSFQFIFAGHYVLLLDYDPRSDSFRYLDPAQPSMLTHSVRSSEHPHCNCVIRATDFEAAWAATGTDHDLIEIPWPSADRSPGLP